MVYRHERSLDQQRHWAFDKHFRIHLFKLTHLRKRDGGQGSLVDHPKLPTARNRARMVPEYQAHDIRELIEKPYRIIYRIKQDQIDVLAVIHSAQLIPEEL